MNDKELLQKIKNVRTAVKEIYGNVNTITYPIYMVDWLIEQAKKAERYEKALREIANEQEVGEGDFNADDVANNLIATAKEALEGEE